LPSSEEGPAGAVLLALEAKAMFTAYSKSYPRFYDELNSSHRAIRGSSNNALAIGLAIVNVADRFISPIINPDHLITRLPVRRSIHSTHNRRMLLGQSRRCNSSRGGLPTLESDRKGSA
jgi:hypothetical protein